MKDRDWDLENEDTDWTRDDDQEASEDVWADRLGPELQETEEPEHPRPPKKEKQREIPTEYLDILAPEKRKLPKWLWILPAAVLVLGLALGGWLFYRHLNPGETEIYYGKVCTLGEKEYSAQGDWVKLKARGRAELNLMDRQRRGDWEIRDNRLIIRCGENLLEGKLREGVMVLEQGDYRFVLAQAGIPWNEEKTQQVLETPRTPTNWQGDYYGWWQVTESWGGWESYAGSRYDACATIWLEEDNTGYFELWDSQCGPDQLVAALDLQVDQGLTDQGSLTFGPGQLMDLPLPEGVWTFDPGMERFAGLQDVLILKGTVTDGADGFSYLILLRPWGLDWKDMDSFPSQDLPIADRLPSNYRDWYLPLLRRGEPMPETLGDSLEPASEK